MAVIREFTLLRQIAIPDISDMLMGIEEAYTAFATTRDAAIVTSHRLILRDVQGLTGTKVETFSVPYRSIEAWSTTSSGRLDFTTELRLWTRVGEITLKLGRNIDAQLLDKALSASVLRDAEPFED